MMHDWYKRKQKPYKKFYKKQLRGNFIDAFKLDIINEEQYDKKKDYFTEKILAQYSDTRYNQKALKLQYGIYKLEGVTQEEKWEQKVEQWMQGYMQCTDSCTGEVTNHWAPNRPADNPPNIN